MLRQSLDLWDVHAEAPRTRARHWLGQPRTLRTRVAADEDDAVAVGVKAHRVEPSVREASSSWCVRVCRSRSPPRASRPSYSHRLQASQGRFAARSAAACATATRERRHDRRLRDQPPTPRRPLTRRWPSPCPRRRDDARRLDREKAAAYASTGQHEVALCRRGHAGGGARAARSDRGVPAQAPTSVLRSRFQRARPQAAHRVPPRRRGRNRRRDRGQTRSPTPASRSKARRISCCSTRVGSPAPPPASHSRAVSLLSHTARTVPRESRP